MTLAKITARIVRAMSKATPEERVELLEDLSPIDMMRLDGWFEAWANEGQLPPEGEGWATWLMMAGRGFGKTRAGAEWVNALAQPRRKQRIAIVGATLDEARRVMVEGRSGILAVARLRGQHVKWEPTAGRLRWPGGTIGQIYSGDSAEGLRGPEHHFAWCDELAKWRDAEAAWDNLQLGLRAGPRPRTLVTTTPRAMELLKKIRAQPRTVETGGRTADNVSLPKRFVALVQQSYGGTRIGRQELEGTLLDDVEGSLFPRKLLDASRCEAVPYDRVVIGVDPPASTHGDACGIVVAGEANGVCHVIADESVSGRSPTGWANAVADAADIYNADRVIAEANNGGEMVATVLRSANRFLPAQLVHATRGKAARAEPIAAGFERGDVKLAGRFDALEEEMAGLCVGGKYEGPGRSPDRADACVWALTALFEGLRREPQIRWL